MLSARKEADRFTGRDPLQSMEVLFRAVPPASPGTVRPSRKKAERFQLIRQLQRGELAARQRGALPDVFQQSLPARCRQQRCGWFGRRPALCRDWREEWVSAPRRKQAAAVSLEQREHGEPRTVAGRGFWPFG